MQWRHILKPRYIWLVPTSGTSQLNTIKYWHQASLTSTDRRSQYILKSHTCSIFMDWTGSELLVPSADWRRSFKRGSTYRKELLYYFWKLRFAYNVPKLEIEISQISSPVYFYLPCIFGVDKFYVNISRYLNYYFKIYHENIL